MRDGESTGAVGLLVYVPGNQRIQTTCGLPRQSADDQTGHSAIAVKISIAPSIGNLGIISDAQRLSCLHCILSFFFWKRERRQGTLEGNFKV